MAPFLPSSLRDPARLAAVDATGLLESSDAPRFDDLVRLATQVTGAAGAMVTLVGADRLVLVSGNGLPDMLAGLRAAPLSELLCATVVARARTLVLDDARASDEHRDHPAVRTHGAIAYAGVPLVGEGGHVVGVLAALDARPHAWTPEALAGLEGLARLAGVELALRRELLERARVERALRAAQEVARVGSWEWDAQRDALAWSPLLREFFGVADDAVPRGFAAYLELLHPDDRAAAQAVIERAGATGEPFAFDHRVVLPDGRVRCLHCRGEVERDTDGGVARMRGSTLDVTDRVQVELALRESEQELRMLGASSPVGLFRADVAGHVVYVNPRAEQLWAASGAELAGHGWLQRVHPDDRDALLAGWTEALVAGRDHAAEYRILLPDGCERHVHGRAAPLHDARGALVGAVGTVEDITERRVAEAALRESEARLAEAQRVARIGSWSLDVASDEVWWSAELFRLFGREPRDGPLSPAEFLATLHPDDRLRVRRTLDAHFAARRAYEIDYRVPWPDGTVRVLRERGEMRCAPDGTLREVFGTAQDVTERVAAEDALRASEERFRVLAEHAPLGISLSDPRGAVVYANATLLAMLGASRESIVGVPWEPTIHPEDRARVADAFRAFLGDPSRDTHRDEFRQLGSAGTVRRVVAESARIRGADGVATGYVNTFADVTERRAAEDALRDALERYRLVQRATRDLIWDWDLAADQIEWSAALAGALGHAAGALRTTSRWWLDHVHPDDRDGVERSLAAVIEGGGESWSAEYRFRRGDGSHGAVLDRGYVRRDASGRAVRMIGAMQDLSERHALEEQLRQAQKMEAVGRLAGGVAHDFNNLLMVISTGTAFVRGELPAEHPVQPDLAMVEDAAGRAARLTRQLLAFSRQQVLRPERVALNDVVRGVEQMLRRLLPANLVLDVALDPALPSVRADVGQLEQVLLNLAVNARDAMPTGGTLAITTARVEVDARLAAAHEGLASGAWVGLVLRDTGMGMDAATRARLFEPFFTTKETGKGTGLGLATVYGIVRQSGGHVLVDSAPGAGSTFTVLLPPDEDVPAPADGAAPPAAAPGSGETILLVEDDAAVRASVRRMLERGGYAVLEAGDGTEALAAVERHAGPLDLVLTDVVMPGTGAGALLARVRELRPGLPALLMSGYSPAAVATQGVLVEGVELLGKPFTTDQLLRRVRHALVARGQRQQR